MQRKGKKSMTVLMALLLMLSLMYGNGAPVSAEDIDPSGWLEAETLEQAADTEAAAEETEAAAEEMQTSVTEPVTEQTETVTEGVETSASETASEETEMESETSLEDTTEASESETESETETEDGLPAVYTARCENIEIKAVVPDGSFEEEVALRVFELGENSAGYQQAESALAEMSTEYDEMRAYDISFVNVSGEEIEPAKAVTVTMSAVLDAESDIEEGSLQISHIDESGNEIGSDSRGNITSAASVDSLAPSIDEYTFSKAVLASSASAAVSSTTEVSYLRRNSGSWQYSSNGRNYTSISSGNQVYFIYESDTSGGDEVHSEGTIKFSYTNGNTINNSLGAISTEKNDYSYMRYTIVLMDEDGTETYLDASDLAEMAVYPSDFNFNSSHITISAATINQMGIRIPGYTFENGYAFFYWSGHFSGDKTVVSDIINYGKKADGGHSVYESNLGYQCTMNGSLYCPTQDYKNAKNYLAYNPTGVLRLVFTRVSTSNPYHVNYVDNFDGSNNVLITQESMDMGSGTSQWDETEQKYYGRVTKLTDVVPGTVHDGYVFAGWYKATDSGDGNGTGDPAQDDVDSGKHFLADVTYYAKWIKVSADLTVSKTVTGVGNTDVSGQTYTFEVQAASDIVKDVAGKTFGICTFDESGKGTVTVSGAGQTTIGNLPVGSYTVTETATAGLADVIVNGKSWYYAENDGPKTAVLTADADGSVIITNTYEPYLELKVQKTVAGSMGDTTADYDFSYTVNYGTRQSFSLRANGSYAISGLKKGDIVTVEEEDYSSDGYITTVKAGNGSATEDREYRTGSNGIQEDTDVTFTNTKNVTAPTGISNRVSPYFVLLLIAVMSLTGLIFTGLFRRTGRR